MSRAIDGAVLTEWISGECKSPSCPKNESAFGMRIIEHIERMPTIEPERKPGHWIDGKCDQCGCHAPYWSMSTTYYKSNYCPECGADMREVEQDG